MRWNVSWRDRGVMSRNVLWRCCWNWWRPASKSPPSEILIRIYLVWCVFFLIDSSQCLSWFWSPFLSVWLCVLSVPLSLCFSADSLVLSQTGGLSLVPTTWTDAGRSLSRRIWWVCCHSSLFLPVCLSNCHHLPAYLLPVCLSDLMSHCLQVLVARQAVRARRRITRRTARQRLMDAKKLLKKLRLLAKEVRGHRSSQIGCSMFSMPEVWHYSLTPPSPQPQTTIPDVFLWLLSGSKRLAYVRIPAYSILFSLVEEQRGQDCGRVTTLYMKVTVLTLTSDSKITDHLQASLFCL